MTGITLKATQIVHRHILVALDVIVRASLAKGR